MACWRQALVVLTAIMAGVFGQGSGAVRHLASSNSDVLAVRDEVIEMPPQQIVQICVEVKPKS